MHAVCETHAFRRAAAEAGMSEKANLSNAECNALRALTKALTAEHRDTIAALAAKKGKMR